MHGESPETGKGFAASAKRTRASGLAAAPRPKTDLVRERRLVAEARAGDPRAVRRLLEAVSPTVYRYGKSFCRDPHDAEDVLQDVMTAMLESLGDFRGDAALSTWAFVVARRTCARRRRRSQRFSSLDSEPGRAARELADPRSSPHRDAERSQLRRALERAIAALPAAQRDVLMLRDVEGKSAAEVARALRLGERAVKSRLHRARVALREALGAWKGEDVSEAGDRCPDTARMLSRHLEGELSAQVCAGLERHVNECESCTDACQSLRSALGACREWGAQGVPREVQAVVRAAIRTAVEERGERGARAE
jgi:RNA polymerase sigma-70 factor (ECF subfamily)